MGTGNSQNNGTAAGQNLLALPAGVELGQYRIIRKLGQGGFGITYLAEVIGSGEQVVIKENLPSFCALRNPNTLQVAATDPDDELQEYAGYLERFVNEARLLAQLKHPNIVKVLGAFEALGTAYYVMPWVGGKELQKAAPASGVITESWLLPILRTLLSTLEYLHGNNIYHRDVKPANILLTEESMPVLIDFGTARAIISDRSATHVGSPGYSPIEQITARGKRGPWTDVYSLGATCYRLITGERPPEANERLAEEDDPLLPLAPRAELLGRFSPAFLATIDKALALRGKNRWQTAAEWLAVLPVPAPQPAPEPADHTTPDIHTTPIAVAPEPARRSRPNVALILLILVLALGIPGGYVLYQHSQATAQQLRDELARVEAERKAKEEAERKAKEEAERKAKEEAERKAKEEDERKAKEEAERKAKEEAERKAKEEDERKAKEEDERKAKEEDERKAKEEDERKAKEEDERKAKEEAERKAAEELARNTERFGELLQQMHAGLSAAQQEIAPAAERVAAGQPLSEQTSLLQHFGTLRQTAALAKSLAAKLPAENISRSYDTLPADPPAFRSFIIDFCNSPTVMADSLSNEQLLALLGWDAALTEAKKNKPVREARRTLRGKGISESKYSIEIKIAARDGDKELLALLIAAGADVNAANKDGETPLWYAASNCHCECVKLLLAAPGIDVNKADMMFGRTPLWWEALHGHSECVKLLLAAPGIDVNKAINSGRTPLCEAASAGRTECVKLLVAAPGIDVNKTDKDGETPLFQAALFGRSECVKLLLAAPGIDVNKATNYGSTPLTAAANNGRTECVKLLLAAPGIDVNKADRYGRTPLWDAAYDGHVECVRLLLAAPGIDVNKASNSGETPLKVAESKFHYGCARLIREAGGKE